MYSSMRFIFLSLFLKFVPDKISETTTELQLKVLGLCWHSNDVNDWRQSLVDLLKSDTTAVDCFRFTKETRCKTPCKVHHTVWHKPAQFALRIVEILWEVPEQRRQGPLYGIAHFPADEKSFVVIARCPLIRRVRRTRAGPGLTTTTPGSQPGWTHALGRPSLPIDKRITVLGAGLCTVSQSFCQSRVITGFVVSRSTACYC